MLPVQMQALGTVPGSRRTDEVYSGFPFLIQLRVFEPPPPSPWDLGHVALIGSILYLCGLELRNSFML